ncbi:hypothetical protein NSQ26_10760 [Bacillus sp. FSL W7-1360]
MKTLKKVVAVIFISFFVLSASNDVYGFSELSLTPTDRTIFSQAYHLDQYSYFGWDVETLQNSRYPVFYEIVKDGRVVKSEMVAKGAKASGLETWGPGEYLLVLKCDTGYRNGCSAKGSIAIAMH